MASLEHQFDKRAFDSLLRIVIRNEGLIDKFWNNDLKADDFRAYQGSKSRTASPTR